MRLVAVSDLHITDSLDPAYLGLVHLFSELSSGDVLFLGGDIFDFYVGRKMIEHRKNQNFFSELKNLSDRGIRILYAEGNHDFHLGFLQEKIQGLTIIESELDFSWQGKRFYLAHGDQVDFEDRNYLKLRKILRTRFMRFLSRNLPDSLLEWIGEKSNSASQNRNQKLLVANEGVRLSRVREIFRAFAESKFKEGFDFVILGHCHDLDEWELNTSRFCHYMNIGYPKTHGHYVEWQVGTPRLVRKPLL